MTPSTRNFRRRRIGTRYLDLGVLGLITWLVWFACTATNLAVEPERTETTPTPVPTGTTTEAEFNEPTSPLISTNDSEVIDMGKYANVTGVLVAGNAGAYRFTVTIESPDTGCDQYADWWEVLSLEGELLYRRVLLHSHANEQPFTRSGSSVNLQPGDEVIVRAHMNTSGYGGLAMRGSPNDGFEQIDLSMDFAKAVETMEPLPTDCDF